VSHQRPLTLGERLEVEAAIDVAYEPLRSRHTDLSARRVRAAVRWGRGAPPPDAVPWSGAVARFSELSVAVGMFVIFFSAGVGSAVLPPEPGPSAPAVQQVDEGIYAVPHVSAALEDERYIRWLRIDRHVPLQDWLDPNMTRTGLAKRLELPAPRGGVLSSGDRF
jgi:hypothetical protein